jgi:hypothetical protein
MSRVLGERGAETPRPGCRFTPWPTPAPPGRSLLVLPLRLGGRRPSNYKSVLFHLYRRQGCRATVKVHQTERFWCPYHVLFAHISNKRRSLASLRGNGAASVPNDSSLIMRRRPARRLVRLKRAGNVAEWDKSENTMRRQGNPAKGEQRHRSWAQPFPTAT